MYVFGSRRRGRRGGEWMGVLCLRCPGVCGVSVELEQGLEEI